MINDINFNALIKNYLNELERLDGTSKRNDEIVLTKYYEYASYIEKEMFQFTYKDFVNFFSYYNWTATNIFANRKCLILKFLNYVEQNGYCSTEYVSDFKLQMNSKDVNRDSVFDSEYYQSFDEFYTLVQKMLGFVSYEDLDKLNPTVCTMYLVWYGFTLEEIIQIKSDAMDYETGMISSSLNGKKKVIHDVRAKNAIQNLSNETELRYIRKFRGNNERVVIKRYPNNEFLIKSLTKPDIKVSYARCLISTFSKLSKNFDVADKDYFKKITYSGIRKSGLYEEINRIELEVGEVISYENMNLYDDKLGGDLLNGNDKREIEKTTKARRIVREYKDFQRYLKEC